MESWLSSLITCLDIHPIYNGCLGPRHCKDESLVVSTRGAGSSNHAVQQWFCFRACNYLQEHLSVCGDRVCAHLAVLRGAQHKL